MRNITGFPGYTVDEDGQVWSLPRTLTQTMRPVAQFLNRQGYSCVSLYHQNKKTNFRVCDLVRLAYIGAQDGIIRHLNGDRSDSRLANLEYPTLEALQASELQKLTQGSSEEFRPITGYPGYFVSSFGRVWAEPKLDHKGFCEGLMLAGELRRDYPSVRLYDGQTPKGKLLLVHRLVAEAFLENPEDLPQVNHIDGNKENNQALNLEWCTSARNHQHAIESGLRVMPKGSDHPKSHMTPETEAQILEALNETDESMRSLARRFNIAPNTVSLLSKRKRAREKGPSAGQRASYSAETRAKITALLEGTDLGHNEIANLCQVEPHQVSTLNKLYKHRA